MRNTKTKRIAFGGTAFGAHQRMNVVMHCVCACGLCVPAVKCGGINFDRRKLKFHSIDMWILGTDVQSEFYFSRSLHSPGESAPRFIQGNIEAYCFFSFVFYDYSERNSYSSFCVRHCAPSRFGSPGWMGIGHHQFHNHKME